MLRIPLIPSFLKSCLLLLFLWANSVHFLPSLSVLIERMWGRLGWNRITIYKTTFLFVEDRNSTKISLMTQNKKRKKKRKEERKEKGIYYFTSPSNPVVSLVSDIIGSRISGRASALSLTLSLCLFSLFPLQALLTSLIFDVPISRLLITQYQVQWLLETPRFCP